MSASSAIGARLTAAALAGHRDDEIFAMACDALAAEGLPIQRAAIGAKFLHPTYEVRLLRWVRTAGIEAQTFDREPDDAPEDEDWLKSPLFRLAQNGELTLRRRIDAASIAEFPLLGEFAAKGGRDYLAFRQPVGRGLVFGEVKEVFTSWVSDREAGFDDAETALLEGLQPTLVLAVSAVANVWIGRALLETYLGRDAARRVVAGNVVRGRTETMRAVIWYSDLRDFTRLSDTLPQNEILALLDEYVEPVVDAVTAEGGEVLKFMGDGILAIFSGPGAVGSRAAALRAWEIASAAASKISAARAGRGAATTQPYLALHAGEVAYGNFGGRNRLDFTVLGPAVNEAARLVALCRSLDQPVILSDVFAGRAGPLRERLVGLGRFALRGVGRPQMLWTLEP